MDWLFAFSVCTEHSALRKLPAFKSPPGSTHPTCQNCTACKWCPGRLWFMRSLVISGESKATEKQPTKNERHTRKSTVYNPEAKDLPVVSSLCRCVASWQALFGWLAGFCAFPTIHSSNQMSQCLLGVVVQGAICTIYDTTIRTRCLAILSSLSLSIRTGTAINRGNSHQTT